ERAQRPDAARRRDVETQRARVRREQARFGVEKCAQRRADFWARECPQPPLKPSRDVDGQSIPGTEEPRGHESQRLEPRWFESQPLEWQFREWRGLADSHGAPVVEARRGFD